MKKMFMSLCGIIAIYSASAQFSVGAFGNYTMYKGEFGKSTPGVGVRAYYQTTSKTMMSLGFNYGLPIKSASYMIVSNGSSEKNVATEMTYNFKTINFMGNYRFGNNEENNMKVYGTFGAGLVLVNMKEKATETYDQAYTPITPLTKENVNGFTINLGLGGEYRLGTPLIFAEAGLALPANKVNDAYVENPIPAHIVINAGIRIPLGSQE